MEFGSVEEMVAAAAEARHYSSVIADRREKAAIWLAVGFGLGTVGMPVSAIVADFNPMVAGVLLVIVGSIWCIGGAKSAWLIVESAWRACDSRIKAPERNELLGGNFILLIYLVPFFFGILLIAIGIFSLLRR